MKLVFVNGIACFPKKVSNLEVYRILDANDIDGAPNIVSIKGNEVLYEYVNGETLQHKLGVGDKLSFEYVTKILYQVAKILGNLRRIGIVHRNLKPENIVITPRGKVYIVDFGHSCFVGHNQEIIIENGDRDIFDAPETTASFKMDMYSFGKIIEMLDEDGKYKNISSKCLEEDPNNRFSDYKHLISQLDKNVVLTNNEKAEEKFNGYFTKEILIFYGIMTIVGVILCFKVSIYDDITFKLNALLIMYFVFLVCDIIDYLRVGLIYTESIKKAFPKKFITSAIMFVIFLFLFMVFK